MLKHITFKNFTGVPWLATSQLVQAHNGRLRFSSTKPNVIVGPNGTGKSALLTTLAIRFLAYYTGQSSFDDNYCNSSDSEVWWTKEGQWGNDWTFLKGLDLKTDNAPALYYRPHHTPGNEESVVTAMMTGYFDLAKAYDLATSNKSTGQANQSMLNRVLEALAGTKLPKEYGYQNWSFGVERRDLGVPRGGYTGPREYQAEVLKTLLAPDPSAVPLILMDEPEQSLDVRAQAKLWQAIAAADCTQMQVIVATHSIFPLLHAKAFNIIEAEPDFVNQVLKLSDPLNR